MVVILFWKFPRLFVKFRTDERSKTCNRLSIRPVAHMLPFEEPVSLAIFHVPSRRYIQVFNDKLTLCPLKKANVANLLFNVQRIQWNKKEFVQLSLPSHQALAVVLYNNTKWYNNEAVHLWPFHGRIAQSIRAGLLTFLFEKQNQNETEFVLKPACLDKEGKVEAFGTVRADQTETKLLISNSAIVDTFQFHVYRNKSFFPIS